MALADNAEKLQHNQDLLVKRTKKLEDLAGFRVPIGAPKAFQRGFKQRYSSDVHLVKEIKGSVVEAEDGKTIDVKRVLPVHQSSDVAEAGVRALGVTTYSTAVGRLPRALNTPHHCRQVHLT